MTWRVSKDGVTFHEIETDYDESTGVDKSLEAAKAKGYKPYQQVTKNGKDVFDIEASEDSLKAAYDKGYKDVGMHEFQGDAGKPNVGDSAFSSLISGFAQTYDDELGGHAEALGSKIGLRGLGSNDMSDVRLEADREDGEDYWDVYRGARDKRRGQKAEAQEANPGIYMTGDILGSAATAGAIPGAATLKGGAAIGAVQGLGRSEADLTDPTLENYGQAIVDTGAGALTGITGYGIGKGVEKAAPVVGRGIKATGKAVMNPSDTFATGMNYLKTVGRGAKAGAKEAGEDLPILGLQQMAAGVGALKGAVKELSETNATNRELLDVAKEARDLLAKSFQQGAKPKIRTLQEFQAIGNGKSLKEFSDDEAIVASLLLDGENAVKKWWAQKAAITYPGQIDAQEYAKIMGVPSAARNTARTFNRKEAAQKLKPVVEEVQDLFKDARTARYGELQDIAKKSYDPTKTVQIVRSIDEAITDSNSLKSIPGHVKSLLEDVEGMVVDGMGTRNQNLIRGKLDQVAGSEHFNRLQRSRELLDSKIKWSNAHGETQAENLLAEVRKNIDDVLKLSPDKIEADSLYRASKEVENKFFGATEFKKNGAIDIDEFKIAKLLGNTDQAGRFRNSIEDLKVFARRPDLDFSFRQRALELIKRLDDDLGVMDTQRALNEFRFKNGPTNQAVERIGSASGGNSLLQDVVQAPAGTLNQFDQFSGLLNERLGKTFQTLSPQEKSAAVKFFVWMKNNPQASQSTADSAWSKLFSQ